MKRYSKGVHKSLGAKKKDTLANIDTNKGDQGGFHHQPRRVPHDILGHQLLQIQEGILLTLHEVNKV